MEILVTYLRPCLRSDKSNVKTRVQVRLSTQVMCDLNTNCSHGGIQGSTDWSLHVNLSTGSISPIGISDGSHFNRSNQKRVYAPVVSHCHGHGQYGTGVQN